MTIDIFKERCTGCSYCTVGCPADAIRLHIKKNAYPSIDESACTNCGECLYLCPNQVFQAVDLAAPPLTLSDTYDAIIVGAGIAGLLTGAGLTKAGKKVLLLEQLSFIGGKYTHLDCHGYAISTAAWTCPGPKSRIGRLTTQLGAQVEWRTIHETKARGDHWLVMRNGRRFENLDDAQETLVGGAKGMAKVYRWIADMYDPAITCPDDMTAREYIQRYLPGNPTYEKYVETIITYCFASQDVDHFSAVETKRAIVDALDQMTAWGTAVGGTAAIVNALRDLIIEHGGTIANRTAVQRININNNRAESVTLMDGRTIRAETILHNAGLNRLLTLAGEENLPADYVARLRGAVPAIVGALILGTNRPLLGNEHSLLHTMGWERTLNCYAPTFFDPALAPPDRHALDVFWVMQPPHDFAKELELVQAELREVFPDLDEAVEMQMPMFFSGAWTAEMAHRLGQSGAQRFDPQTPVENLYMVGYDCIGYGMAGDIIPHGVQRALYLILGDPAYAPELEDPAVRRRSWLKSRLFRALAFIKGFSR